MEYRYSDGLGFISKNFEYFFYCSVAFFVPFIIGDGQYLTGTIVNAAIIVTAMKFGDSRMLPIIMLPSLGVLSRGLIFGPFTYLLVFMIPFIWVGNGILAYVARKFKKHYWLAVGSGAVTKSLFLFLIAAGLQSAGILPALFLNKMGMLQLLTALAGGVVAFFAIRR